MATAEQRAFLDKIGPMAAADMQKTGILASLTVAQAILESGWGKSGLTLKANNLFGIKGAYNGASVSCKTQEWDGSKYITITALSAISQLGGKRGGPFGAFPAAEKV